MPDGGFLVRFMRKDKEVESLRCYKVCLEYDAWRYSINNEEEKSMPDGITKIEVILE